MAGGDPMKPSNPGVKLTYDDFVLFPDDGQRHELIDGEHYVTPSPNKSHQQILGDLTCFTCRTKRLRVSLTPQHVRGTPDLVVEIGSPGTRKRDETIKRRLYERSGVVEYWFIDPDRAAVRMYRSEGGRFQPAPVPRIAATPSRPRGSRARSGAHRGR